MEHTQGIRPAHIDLIREIEAELELPREVLHGRRVIYIDSLSPDLQNKIRGMVSLQELEPLRECLKIEACPDIPDLSCMMDDYRYIEDSIPNKAKSVIKADGFNPPPTKGRKQRYHR